MCITPEVLSRLYGDGIGTGRYGGGAPSCGPCGGAPCGGVGDGVLLDYPEPLRGGQFIGRPWCGVEAVYLWVLYYLPRGLGVGFSGLYDRMNDAPHDVIGERHPYILIEQGLPQ